MAAAHGTASASAFAAEVARRVGGQRAGRRTQFVSRQPATELCGGCRCRLLMREMTGFGSDVLQTRGHLAHPEFCGETPFTERYDHLKVLTTGHSARRPHADLIEFIQ